MEDNDTIDLMVGLLKGGLFISILSHRIKYSTRKMPLIKDWPHQLTSSLIRCSLSHRHFDAATAQQAFLTSEIFSPKTTHRMLYNKTTPVHMLQEL